MTKLKSLIKQIIKEEFNKSNTWTGEVDNLNDFIEMVRNLPETLEYLKVPTKYSSNGMASGDKVFNRPIDDSKKEEIISILKKLYMEHKKANSPITSYRLNSYYGVGRDPEKHKSHPGYIQVVSDDIRKFAQDMSSGKYGRLD